MREYVWQTDTGPFGEGLSLSGVAVNPLRFPGQVYDEDSGWHDNGWRTYDPALGRYLQSDPIGLAGGINRYAYVEGNPLSYIDPSGENPAVIRAALGVAASAAAIIPTLPEIQQLPLPDLSKFFNKPQEPEKKDHEKPYAGQTPEDEPDDFYRIKGCNAQKNKKDGSIWEPDYSQHGGSTWKRWPDQKNGKRTGIENR